MNTNHTEYNPLMINNNIINANLKPNKQNVKIVPKANQMNSSVKCFLYSLINNSITKENIPKKKRSQKETKQLMPVQNKTLFDTFIHSSATYDIKEEDNPISFKPKELKAFMKDLQKESLNNTETGILNNKTNSNQSSNDVISESSFKNYPTKLQQSDSLNKEDASSEISDKNKEDKENKEDVGVDNDDESDSRINKIIDLNKSKRKEFSTICDKFKSSIIFNGQSLKRFNEKLKIVETKYYIHNDTLDLDEINKNRTDDLFRHIERKEHVYDSISESEEDEIINNCFIDPHSTFCFYFDMIIAFCALYSFIFVPIDIAFHLNEDIPLTNWRMIMNFIICTAFIIDFFLSFFIAYMTFEDEQMMTDGYDLAINYLQSWFIIDLLSATPFVLILKWNKPTHTEYVFTSPIAIMLQLLRIFQIFKFLKIIFRNSFMALIYSLCIDNQHLNKWFRVYISVIIYFCCNHLLCCVFIFLAKLDYPNWIVNKNLEFDNQGEVYVASLYFIFTTIYTIGYGDICSYNDYERIFNIILLIVGIMAYSYALSALSNFVMEEDYCTAQFHKKLAILEEISHSNRSFSDSLFRKIYLHLKYKLKNEQSSFNEIISDLPFGLRNTLIYEMYKPIIENFIFFKSFDNIEFIIKVILAMKPALVSKNDKLVKEGDFVEEIYFVKRGNLVIEIPLPTTSTIRNKSNMKLLSSTINQGFSFTKTKTLSKKSLLPAITSDVPPVPYVKLLEIRRNEHFGDVLMFSNRKSPLALKVKSKIAELFLLAKTDAVEISMQFPNIWRTIIKKSLYNMEQIEKLLNKSIHNFLVKNITNNDGDSPKKSTQIVTSQVNQRNKTIVEEESKFEKSSIVNKQSHLSKIDENNSQDNEGDELMIYTSSRNISSLSNSNTLKPNAYQCIEIISNKSESINSICSENLSLKTRDLHYSEINEILPTLVSTNGIIYSNNSNNKTSNETTNRNDKSKVNTGLIDVYFQSNSIQNHANYKIESASSFKIKPSIDYYPTNHSSVFIKGSKLSISDLDVIIQQFVIANQNKKDKKLIKLDRNFTDLDKSIESTKPRKKHITVQFTEQKAINIDNDITHKNDYLSKIDFNIRKSSQNLNNPESFYSQYFHSMLNIKKPNDVMTELDRKVDDFFELIKKKNLKQTN